ncbi:MAG: GAF domain-containing protein [Lachnospiraceae bacterium]|nr:GAF domain-containing protein [Lachnospiraceae bacterium]
MNKYTTDQLIRIMVSLSAEHNIDKLLEQILTYAMEITSCDGGTLYTKDGDFLRFKNMITVSKDIYSSAAKGTLNLPPVPIGRTHVCACSVLDKRMINLPDIYESKEYDFNGAKQYDALNDYRTGSMLVIPMVDEKERVIGVLQLINALSPSGEVIPFDESFEELIYGLASLVAVCMNNQRLSKAFYDLLHSFVQTMVGAIDLRTPYNANHTKSMVHYASRFIAWLNRQRLGWRFPQDAIDPFLMSVWLHDIGKLVTPLSVMEKATRLGTRKEAIEHRITVAILMEEINGLKHPSKKEASDAAIEELKKARETILSADTPGFLNDELLAAIQALSDMTCRNERGEEIPLLTEDEFTALNIRRGTLTAKERRIIESHVTYTAQMLSNVRFEGDYAQVPIWASSHHELLDGSGYPDHRKAEDLPKEVRLLTILDVYDALTAGDRPYKPPLPTEKAFSILESMAEEGKIDSEILAMFKESNAWQKGEV